MKLFFKELFEYNHDANQKILEAIIAQPENVSEKSIKLFSHILNAHRIWNNRIDPLYPVFGVWAVHTIDTFKEIEQLNFEHSLLILGNFDINENVNYTNSAKKVFNNTKPDILFHIINHSTYHRGQIATEFRQSGIEPVPTDYIFFKR